MLSNCFIVAGLVAAVTPTPNSRAPSQTADPPNVIGRGKCDISVYFDIFVAANFVKFCIVTLLRDFSCGWSLKDQNCEHVIKGFCIWKL